MFGIGVTVMERQVNNEVLSQCRQARHGFAGVAEAFDCKSKGSLGIKAQGSSRFPDLGRDSD